MKIFIKNCGLFIILSSVYLLCLIETGCINEFISTYVFRDKEAKKRIEWYKAQYRDEKLQGWWQEEKHDKDCIFFDFLSGEKIYYYMVDRDFHTHYWYTKGDTLYDAMCSKDWPNGMCESANFYLLKGDSIFEESDCGVDECKKNDPNTKWDIWNRVTNKALLDSLKQYEVHRQTFIK